VCFKLAAEVFKELALKISAFIGKNLKGIAETRGKTHQQQPLL
jgi:hypothetical protein